ncbi:MAG TPA: tRNA epoxyqueuosine(34) reductase QueG [Thiobacillaceae bacterium]|nr:tRNA epoxyqueuosine(34) reductase QueG [Thiobacillaceae bacterium]
MHAASSPTRHAKLAHQIKAWGRELGFAQIGIADTDLSDAELRLQDWLTKNFHGEMDYMAAHGAKRSRPHELVPGTVRIITARLNYWPEAADAIANLADPRQAYVSRYAVGRDYHKVLRSRLEELAEKIESVAGPFGYRVFTDSAPVMEVELATKSGLGWRGKHTLLINQNEGSYFFLGEIYTDLPLPADAGFGDHCGSCFACAAACPTGAIIGPFKVDARRCISYLTIELKGSIPLELRPLIGNRIYGCDDCQLVCPWNRFAQRTTLPDFQPRHDLDSATLLELFGWSEEEFLKNTEGSAIRRIGYDRWLRNIAVALGNAPASVLSIAALNARLAHPSALVREHVEWALQNLAPSSTTLPLSPPAARG